jgi:hypothetical protein
MTRKLALIIGVPIIMVGVALGGYRVANAASGQNQAGQNVSAPKIIATCTGTHVWAVVNADGSLARAGGACAGTHVTAFGSGQYDVNFPKNIVNCAYVVTVGSSGRSGGFAPGYAATVGDAGTTNGVFVETFDSSGAGTSEGFHLVVDC